MVTAMLPCTTGNVSRHPVESYARVGRIQRRLVCCAAAQAPPVSAAAKLRRLGDSDLNISGAHSGPPCAFSTSLRQKVMQYLSDFACTNKSVTRLKQATVSVLLLIVQQNCNRTLLCVLRS